MIPLSVPHLAGRELKYLKKCVDTNWVSSSGSFVTKFEEIMCSYVESPYAIACVNGTAGLQIALKLCGVQTGDEVLVPTLTFIAPINAVKYLGAEPVFMDCDDYMNIDPVKLKEFCAQECQLTKAGLKNKKSGRLIKAILPVHVFGNPCDMEGIMRIAKTFKLKVIEDATESLGAYYTQGVYKGQFTGTIGDVGVFSFNGNKIITTGGGGMMVTASKTIAAKAQYLIEQAKDDPVHYIHNEIGYNFRLTNLQAALGLAQMEQLKKFIQTKRTNYKAYQNHLAGVPGLELLGVPQGTAPNYWFYSLLIDQKKYGMNPTQLMNALTKAKIQTRPLWYLNHLQKPYVKNQSYKIEKAPIFLKRVLNLPCSSSLNLKQLGHVVKTIIQLGH